jgi:hypothetical protein
MCPCKGSSRTRCRPDALLPWQAIRRASGGTPLTGGRLVEALPQERLAVVG